METSTTFFLQILLPGSRQGQGIGLKMRMPVILWMLVTYLQGEAVELEELMRMMMEDTHPSHLQTLALT